MENALLQIFKLNFSKVTSNLLIFIMFKSLQLLFQQSPAPSSYCSSDGFIFFCIELVFASILV